MIDNTSTTRRQILVDSLGAAGAVAVLAGVADAADATPNPMVPSGEGLPTGDIHDFDFLVGKWNFVNRRLKKRWVGSDEWETFPASLTCESRLHNIVNMDEGYFPTKGWSGMTVRVFSPKRRQWCLYWINSSTGEMFPPVIGGFKGDRGEFYGEDTDEGRPIKVVFRWARLGPDKARWEQAFSLDGKQWETNWIMEHTRAKS